jgi:hypothetical protein
MQQSGDRYAKYVFSTLKLLNCTDQKLMPQWHSD